LITLIIFGEAYRLLLEIATLYIQNLFFGLMLIYFMA